MMHRDTGALDEFEVLCAIPQMKVQRLRMRKELDVTGLKAEGQESIVTPLVGTVEVTLEGAEAVRLAEKDVYYIPAGAKFSLTSTGDADVIWASAPAERGYPAYVKRFAEISPVHSGAGTYRRSIYTAIGEKDPGNRFLMGFVEGEEGNWTSFPPHRHDGKPEVYVYYGMGERFGLQVVVGDEDRAYLVRDGDAVLFERGYHPNVATPGVGMRFAWIISADSKERNLSVELHPSYKDMPMGQTHLTTK